MTGLNLKQAEKSQAKQISRLMGRIKLSNFMELPDKDFAEFVKRVEQDPLFIRLAFSKNKEEKAISYKRFNRTGVAKFFHELREDVLPAVDPFDSSRILGKRREIVSVIKKLGIDKFRQYFLYNEREMTPEEIAVECNLDVTVVREINRFVDDVSICAEFCNPSSFVAEKHMSYSKIASIEKAEDGKYYICYFCPNLLRGRYVIDYEKISNLKRRNAFSKKELGTLDKLLRNLEFINKRKSIIDRILKHIVETQFHYLNSSDPLDLVPFSQSELAQKIEVDVSLVNRAIGRRSIDAPWQEEKPLKYFFPSKKDVRKNLIKKVVMEEQKPRSDEEIRVLLGERFGITISRRSVSDCRRELGISHSWERRKEERRGN